MKGGHFIRIASAYLSRPFKSKVAFKNPGLSILSNIYKDYKSLKLKYPVNRREYLLSKYQLKRIKRHGKMIQRRQQQEQLHEQQQKLQNNDVHGDDLANKVSPTSSHSNSSSSSSSDEDNDALQPQQSRRQRLVGLARTARDVYIPKISGSVSQIASGRAFGTDKYDEYGRIKIPEDATITLYPTYTRLGDDNKYHVDIGGWLSCPGLMTRKNRLIFSLVKQIIKYDSNQSQQEQALNNLESDSLKPDMFNDANSESDSIVSEGSSLNLDTPDSAQFLHKHSTSNNVTSNGEVGVDHNNESTRGTFTSNEMTFKERLGYFMARFIANAELTVVIGSEQELPTDQLKSEDFLTDGNGCFNKSISVDYKPSVVQVTAKRNDSIFTCEPIYLVPNDGIAIISDIDDTIKLTGVIGDKRELLTSLLLRDVAHWKIPAMVEWYVKLLSSNNVTFHYVSNSPLQLFPIILQYFKTVGLPPGSLHLKQYTGNILSSLMEPSSSRKKTALNKIVNDFPQKKFVCIGDSGEYDFESYIELARNYPERILAIYIRHVAKSLSNLDDIKVLYELNRILQSRKIKPMPEKKEDDEPSYKPHDFQEMDDLIDLSDTPVALPSSPSNSSDNSTTNSENNYNKSNIQTTAQKEETQRRSSRLPPLIPKKPTVLKGNQLKKVPPLPSRNKLRKPHTDSDLVRETPPVLPKRPLHPITSINFENPSKQELMDNLTNIYYSHNFEDLQNVDEKGAEWIQRVMEATKQLEHTTTTVRFINDKEGDLYEITRDILNDVSEKV